MSETPVQVIIAAYPTPDGAANKMRELEEVRNEGLIHVVDMAVVVKEAGGKLKITNSKRRSTRGFLTGGVVGGLVGLLAGPVGLVALGGGAIGALAGKLRGAPLKHELQNLGESLTPNASAIVAVVEHTWVADLQRALAAEGAQVINDAIKADIATQLEAGGSVLYSAGATSSGMGAVRVADSPQGSSIGGVMASGDVVSGGRISESAEGTSAAGFTSTPEGVSGRGITVTPDEVRAGAFAATSEGVYVEHATLTDEAPAAGGATVTETGTPAPAPQAGSSPPPPADPKADPKAPQA